MSATDWSICPICKKKLEDIKREKYGKVSAEEYEELIAQFKPEDNESEESVREDYEVYFDKEGNWVFDGGAGCENCGTDWEGKFIMKPKVEKEAKDDK